MNRTKKYIIVFFGFLFSGLVPFALAESVVTVEVIAQKKIMIVKEGRQVAKFVGAEKVLANDVIYYALKYSNSGTRSVRNITISDPIPENTVYISGSATGKNPEFSVDGGKTFGRPSYMALEIKMPNGAVEKILALPEEYTHIRWIIEEIKGGQTGSVGFQVRVK